MMEEVRDAALILCLLTIACTAMEAIMPEGTVRRYARFVFSLITMTVLLRPLLLLIQWITENLP